MQSCNSKIAKYRRRQFCWLQNMLMALAMKRLVKGQRQKLDYDDVMQDSVILPHRKVDANLQSLRPEAVTFTDTFLITTL